MPYQAIDSHEASKVVENATRETLPNLRYFNGISSEMSSEALPILMVPVVFVSCLEAPVCVRPHPESDRPKEPKDSVASL